jgi:prepilin-type N-terminal cleavage/methylation domain-containing protein
MKMKVGGYTLVELMIVIMLIGIFTAATQEYFVDKIRQTRTDLTISEIWELGKAAKAYRVDNGEWPDQTNNCANTIALVVPAYTENIDVNSPWYDVTDNPSGAYVFDCNAQTFGVTVGSDADWASYISNNVTSTLATGTSSRTAFSLPSSVPALAGLLHRDADAAHPEYNQMNTDIDMNSFNINNIGTATAQDLISSIKNRSLAQSIQDATVTCHNGLVNKPSCPVGQTPQIFTTVMMVSENATGNPLGAIQAYATSISAAQWRAQLRILTKTGWVYPSCTYGKVVAFTKCT